MSKEHAYAYESGYQDGLRAAESDNAKLRERVAELEELTDGRRYIPQEWYAQLKAENDRLRALLQDVAICASGNYCYDCPHQHDGCDRDERLRAEGIEVMDV